jgi:hypothetical protein
MFAARKILRGLPVSSTTAVREKHDVAGNGHMGRAKKEESKPVRIHKKTADMVGRLAQDRGMDVADYIDFLLLPAIEKDKKIVATILKERMEELLKPPSKHKPHDD